MADHGGTSGKWGDLAPRVVSGLVLGAIGAVTVWLGGVWFLYTAAIAAGFIVREITKMCAGIGGIMPVITGVVAGAALVFSAYAEGWILVTLLVGVPVVATAALPPSGDRVRSFAYLGWVMVAIWGIIDLRMLGAAPVLWLVLLVIASDIAGYFAGRIIGGPKFWPRVSPKKTWAGTIAGWIAAGIVGVAFVPYLGTGIIWLSVLVSFASQMGDAAESALKRSKGVKDASAVIPGHGGVFDRFDALLGAAFVVTLARLAGFIGG